MIICLVNKIYNYMKRYPRVLAIAGSEPLGSAGIQADTKAISACGAYSGAAITCVVDENTTRVKTIFPLPVELVTGQIESFLGDVGADAIKTGVLYSADLIKAVTESVAGYGVRNIVVDPVVIKSSGERMVDMDTVAAFKKYLFPMARVITPNMGEAGLLLDRDAAKTDWKSEAKSLSVNGCAVLIKSVPEGDKFIKDIFYDPETGQTTVFTKDRIDTRNINGTGCSLSSSIAAFLARGYGLEEAVRSAEDYIHHAIVSGAQYYFGVGFGPVNHFYKYNE